MQSFIEIGQIVAFRGFDGTMKVKTESNTNFINLKNVFIDNIEYTIKKISKNNNFLFLTLINYDNLSKVMEFKNKLVFVKRENIKLNKNEYLICDMLGLNVYNSENEFLGQITEIENYGSKDIYTVKNGKNEITFCLIDGLFDKVDLENETLILNSKILNEVMV